MCMEDAWNDGPYFGGGFVIYREVDMEAVKGNIGRRNRLIRFTYGENRPNKVQNRGTLNRTEVEIRFSVIHRPLFLIILDSRNMEMCTCF